MKPMSERIKFIIVNVLNARSINNVSAICINNKFFRRSFFCGI